MLAVAGPIGIIAQEKPAPPDKPVPQERPAPPNAGPPVPVRVQLVLSRYEGDKRISSMPYTLQLISNERDLTRLRMGVEVPVANGAGGFNYRPVGTNIDCRVEGSPGGFRLSVTVTDSSIRMAEDEKTAMGVATKSAPAFRNFTATFTILLRDGQTAQYTTATDPLTGEVLKVDATLTVLK
jgi:hypothetical protein